MFRAREITHPEVGRELLDRFYQRINDIANVERSAHMEGRMLSMVVMPDPKAIAAAARLEAEPSTATTESS
jgi:translation initiation factor IF-3